METSDAESWYNAGNEKIAKGNNEEAIADYEKALELNPAHISALNNKGIALYRLTRYEEALSCYDEAIAINPNHANAWYNKANAIRGLAQSYLDKANNDRTGAAKLINHALALFDSASDCYNKGESISGHKT